MLSAVNLVSVMICGCVNVKHKRNNKQGSYIFVIERVRKVGGGVNICTIGNGRNGLPEVIVFSDLYSPSNLVVATFKNSCVLLHFSVWEDAQSD